MTITDVVGQIQSMDEALLGCFKKHSVPVVHMKAEKAHFVYLPSGWILCERSHDGPLTCVARKSMFFKSKGTVANYALANALLPAAGHDVGRMEQVANVLQHED